MGHHIIEVINLEIYKDIIGWEDRYQISNYGNIKSKRKNIVMKPCITKAGYLHITLKNSKTKMIKSIDIHRLVALHFIENPENKLWINHIDNNKLNNCVSNLEWCTPKENMAHCIVQGRLRPQNGADAIRKKYSKPVKQLTLTRDIINIFESTNDASRKTNIDQGSIVKACNGIYKQYKGYVWEYIT